MTTKRRSLKEISEAEDEMFDRVWYDRHQLLRKRDDAPLGEHPGDEAAARLEEKYGAENLGPYDDVEWGMLNGKLSALRWVLGEDWDMLDT